MQPFLKVGKEMESKRLEHLLERKKLMYELDTLALDVRMVTKRREISDHHLGLAQEGRLGINYHEKKSGDTET